MKPRCILATTIASLLLASALPAATFTWDGGSATTNNISDTANWNPDGAPPSNLATTDLVFDGTVRLTPIFSAVFSANSVTFNNNAAANAFTFGGSTLTIGTGGMTNNDANIETFNNQVTIGTATSTFNAANAGFSFSTVALGTNALALNGAGPTIISTITGSGTLTKSAGNFTYGPGGAATQAWDLAANSAALVTLSPSTDLTVSTTGSITVSGATFNAAGNVTMDATPFLLSGASSSFSVQPGKTLALQNGASLTSTGIGITHNTAGTVTATGSGTVINSGTSNLAVNIGGTLNVFAGADATFGALAVGGSGTATVLFDDAGSTATSGAGVSTIGNGATGILTFSNAATGSFGAINLATSASSNGQFNIQSGANVTTGSVLMVDDSLASESGTLTVNGVNSSFTIAAAGTLTVGAASLSTASVNVQNSGTLNTGTGTTTLNATGVISITGGTFNANGNLTLNGGDLSTDASGALNIAAGKTFTVQNGSTANLFAPLNFHGVSVTVTGTGSILTTSASGALSFNGGATIQVTSFGHLDTPNSLSFGNTEPGTQTVTVDGAGSQISGLTGGTWGANGGVANVTFSTNAAGSFGGTLSVGNGGSGTVLVQSGADVSSAQLLIGNTVAAGTSGAVTVTGAGSTWTITGANFLGIGAASGSTGSLTVASGGVFNSGTGNSVINATGTLALNGGTFVANGGLTVSGGQFTRSATGAFTLPASRALIVQSGGDAIFTGAYTNSTASTITITDAGSTFSTSGILMLNGGSTTSVFSGGSLSSGVNQVNIGTSGDGTVTVDGSGSSFTGGLLFVGASGTGSLTFSSGSTGSFGEVTVDASVSLGSSGTFLVQGGASVTGTRLTISPNAVGNNGLLAVLGAGSAFTLTGAATTSIGTSSASVGTLEALSGGTFTSGTGAVTLNATGVIHIDGGTVILRGPLVRHDGVVNFTAGSLSIIDNWNVGSGGLLGTNVTLDAARQMTTTATTTIDAFRTLTLSGGTLNTGALVNNGAIAFNSGTLAITGAGGFNIGSGALGANVTVGAGANLQVTNTATVASGATLTMNGGVFTAGTLNVTGTVRASIGTASAGTGTNNSGGRIFIGDTLDISGAFTNASGARITLENGAGLLSGAGTLNNSGLVTGDGTIAKPLTNGTTGEVRGELGRTLTVTGATINSGSFNLLGGALDFTSTVTNNASGFISGHGALFTGGLANAGVIAVSGGNLDIRGDVTINAGARVATSGAGVITTFYDDVVHNGLEIFTGANASTVFYGSQSGAGNFTGTGTVYFIGDLRPGNSPALVNYGGDVVIGQFNSLTMEIGGLTRGTEYDAIDVAGQLTLGGLLDVALYGGFAPHVGDRFDLFDAGEMLGAFDSIDLPSLEAGLEWDATQLQSTGEIRVVPEPGIGALLSSTFALLGLRRRIRPLS